MSGRIYWTWLSCMDCAGTWTKLRLLQKFGTPERIFCATGEELRQKWLRPEDIAYLEKRDLTPARIVMGQCAATGMRTVTMDDSEYPARLKNIADPPILLYVRGNLPPIDDVPVVAMVGTRSCTDYGLRMAHKLGYDLAKLGFVVATGLARGIDTAAAQGALEAGGTVIGVLGGGADVVYPAENKPLFEAVLQRGCILSEYAPGTEPKGPHFPVRNRILSGLSLGVIVVEAPEKSGALITANRALEQGRDVFVVPGPADEPSCMGSNHLLRECAAAVTCAADVAEEYSFRFAGRLSTGAGVTVTPEPREEKVLSKRENPPKQEEKIDKPQNGEYTSLRPAALEGDDRITALAITEENMMADDIIAASGLGAGKTLAALTRLEILGAVVRSEGKRYTLNVSVK